MDSDQFLLLPRKAIRCNLFFIRRIWRIEESCSIERFGRFFLASEASNKNVVGCVCLLKTSQFFFWGVQTLPHGFPWVFRIGLWLKNAQPPELLHFERQRIQGRQSFFEQNIGFLKWSRSVKKNMKWYYGVCFAVCLFVCLFVHFFHNFCFFGVRCGFP